MNHRREWTRYVCLGIICLAAMPHVASAQALDERFLQGLRGRRLFTLGEKFCQEQLAKPQLDARQKSAWSIEWSRTCAEQALHATLDERARLWTKAITVLEAFSRQHAKHSQETLVQAQAAVVLLMQGELLRQEAELVADQGARVEQARTLLRDSLARFDLVARQIDDQLRERNREMNATLDLLSVAELTQLQKNMRLQRVRAFRNQAQTYAVGSPDRVSSLDRAVLELKPLVGLDPSDPLCFAGRIEEIVCLRLLEDVSAAADRLAALDELHPPLSIAWRVKAETLRLLLAKNLPQAVQLLDKWDAAESPSPDWHDAALEVQIAAWKTAAAQGDAPGAARLQQAASRRVEWIERHESPYWSRRAETRLAGQISTAPASGDGDGLKRSAESFYRAGQIEQALTTYDELVRRATAELQPQRALDAAYTAAAIEQQRGHYEAAAKRFRAAAQAAPQLEKARDAHLAAIYATAKSSAQPTVETTRAYQELLAEHLKLWPSGATSDQARLWLGQLCEGRREWSAAVDAYRAIAPGGVTFAAARQGLARAYLAWLAQEQSTNRPTAALATTAATLFEQQITRGKNVWPETWTDEDRDAALVAVRIWLDYGSQRATRAEQLISAALMHSAAATPEWVAQAKLLKIQAQVAQNKLDAAAQFAQELTILDDERLLRLLDAWQQQAERAPSDTREALGKLRLVVAARRSSDRPLEGDARRRFDLQRGLALLDAGRRSEALELLQSLSAKFPQDGSVQAALARAMSRGSSSSDQQAALLLWRDIERRSRPGSERWFRAKLELARCHVQLGHVAQAQQIVELTKLLHPALGGPELKAAFGEVLRPSVTK